MGKIVIELTNRCNLRCQHCHSGRHGGGDDLPLPTLERILREARENGFDQIALTGGDPTVHPSFGEAVRSISAAGYRFGLVTNGVSFKRVLPVLEAFRENLSVVTFSLDGAAEDTHDRIRGPSSYRKVMQAVSMCVIKGLPFTFNMVVTAHNAHEVGAVARLAADLGSSGLRFGHLMPTPHTGPRGLDLSPDERKSVEAEIRRLGAGFAIPVGMAPGYHAADLFPCAPLQRSEINVDCFGNVTLCCHLSGHGEGAGAGDVAGNLNEESLRVLLDRLAWMREDLREEKIRRQSNGELHDMDLFPCRYCSLHFRKLDWLQERPCDTWPQLVQISGPPRTEEVLDGPAVQYVQSSPGRH